MSDADRIEALEAAPPCLRRRATMETKFRKKPVIIEATQWFNLGDHPAVVMKADRNRYADEGVPWIETLEGGHVVSPGDWIITGVKGEQYPCKPDIFAATYEAVHPAPAAPAVLEPPDAALAMSADGTLSLDDAIAGVVDLFPSAHEQALRCLGELLTKRPPARTAARTAARAATPETESRDER